MNILHTIGYLNLSSGGPVESLKQISNYQVQKGHNVTILHTFQDIDGTRPKFNKNVKIISLKSYTKFRFSSVLFKNTIIENFKPDVIHAHGIWRFINVVSYLASSKLKIPFVISPCGMLQENALKIARWQKLILWNLIFKNCLENSSQIIVKSDSELLQLKKYVRKKNTTIIPNTIEIPLSIKKFKKENQIVYILSLIHI